MFTDNDIGSGTGCSVQLATHRSGAVGAVPPQFSIGLRTVGAVVLKLRVVSHKGKLNGKKH